MDASLGAHKSRNTRLVDERGIPTGFLTPDEK